MPHSALRVLCTDRIDRLLPARIGTRCCPIGEGLSNSRNSSAWPAWYANGGRNTTFSSRPGLSCLTDGMRPTWSIELPTVRFRLISTTLLGVPRFRKKPTVRNALTVATPSWRAMGRSRGRTIWYASFYKGALLFFLITIATASYASVRGVKT